ncbi:hypothetical protein ACIQMR_38155 [Streptomyces sp. NPDC091376]|uniref:hypothetical protein n=1 Tax=Streptomyces sp. NPDC091376 TaxID=3365994 RepID=UPI0037FF11A5
MNPLLYDEAIRIRQEAKRLQSELTNLIVDEHVGGRTPKTMAHQLDLTESYVYRILRDNKWEAAWRVEELTGNGRWQELKELAPGIRWSGTWNTSETAEQVAARIMTELSGATRTKPLRIRIWRGSPIGNPRLTTELPPSA